MKTGEVREMTMADLKARLSGKERRAARRAVLIPMLEALMRIDMTTPYGEYARRLVNGAVSGTEAVDLRQDYQGRRG